MYTVLGGVVELEVGKSVTCVDDVVVEVVVEADVGFALVTELDVSVVVEAVVEEVVEAVVEEVGEAVDCEVSV